MEIYHEKLFRAVIDGVILTKDYLHLLGIFDDDINKFLERGHMIKTGDTYQYVNVDALILYARSLIRSKDFDRSKKCYDLCIKLDPKNIAVNFELFKRAIDENNFDLSIKYFSILYKNCDYKLKSEMNTYLFLLSYICVLPKKLKEELDSLTKEDLKICEDANFFDSIDFHNSIRMYIYNEQFVKALGGFNVLKANGKKISFPNILIKKLIYKTIICIDQRTCEVKKALDEKNYILLLSILSERRTSRITRLNFFMKKMVIDILKLQNGEEVVELNASNGDNLFSCIKKGDYKKAKQLFLETNDTEEMHIIKILLTDVCELLDKKELFEVPYNNQLNDEIKQEIIKLIVLEGISIDEACRQFGLNSLQSATINLIFAREYYAVQDFDYGDRILRSLENTIMISDTLKELYTEISNNRNLYSTIIRSDEVPFIRLLKPKKVEN